MTLAAWAQKKLDESREIYAVAENVPSGSDNDEGEEGKKPAVVQKPPLEIGYDLFSGKKKPKPKGTVLASVLGASLTSSASSPSSSSTPPDLPSSSSSNAPGSSSKSKPLSVEEAPAVAVPSNGARIPRKKQTGADQTKALKGLLKVLKQGQAGADAATKPAEPGTPKQRNELEASTAKKVDVPAKQHQPDPPSQSKKTRGKGETNLSPIKEKDPKAKNNRGRKT